MIKTVRTYIYLVAAMLAWGSVYPISKYLMTDISPLTIGFLRYFTAIIFLIPLFIYETIKNHNKIDYKTLFYLFASGIFGTFLFSILLFKGVALSTASNGSIIINTQPVFAALFAFLFFHEKINIIQILGIIFGIVGLFLVVSEGTLSAVSYDNSSLRGNVLLILGSISMSLYGFFIRKPVKKIGGFSSTIISMFLGTTILFFIDIIFVDNFFAEILSPRGNNILLILYLGFFGTAAAYLLFTLSLKNLEVVTATGFKFLIPVSGVTLSMIFLGERPAMIVYAGIIIVVLSVFLIQFKNLDKIKNFVRRSFYVR